MSLRDAAKVYIQQAEEIRQGAEIDTGSACLVNNFLRQRFFLSGTDQPGLRPGLFDALDQVSKMTSRPLLGWAIFCPR